MVKLMLDGFGGDVRRAPSNAASPHGIECYHVDARLARTLKEIGELSPRKGLLLLRYFLQAVWCRFRHGVRTMYYVPCPGNRAGLVRDWIVLQLCRPFFPHLILHWHAAGLARWLEFCAQGATRSQTYRLFKHVALSIVLSRFNRADAEKLLPQRIAVVSNGIPDPCPHFEAEVLPRRLARAAARRRLLAGAAPGEGDPAAAGAEPGLVRVLYLAHCTREKGVVDAWEGVRLANRRLAAARSPLRLRLHIAGGFVDAQEQAELETLMADEELRPQLEYHGFVAGEAKDRLLRDADLFCFPTYFSNENQPVNLIEALAYGLPVVTTRWRSVPEILPPNYPGLVAPRQPAQVAESLIALLAHEAARQLRDHFTSHYTIERHLANLAAALRSIETPAACTAPGSAPAPDRP